MNNIQIQIKDFCNGKTQYWIEDSENELVQKFSDFLYEKDIKNITVIDQVLEVRGSKIKSYSFDKKWELIDKINERLQLLRDDYHDFVDSSYKDDLFYRMAVL
jgi:hypothetical protein